MASIAARNESGGGFRVVICVALLAGGGWLLMQSDNQTPAPAGDGPAATQYVSPEQQQRDDNGLRNVCAACGHDDSRGPLGLTEDGSRVHKGHLTDPNSGLYGKGQ